MTTAHKHRSLTRNLRGILDPAIRRFLEDVAESMDEIHDEVIALENANIVEWRDFVMQNGWTRYATTHEQPQYYKNECGCVTLKGDIAGGTTTNGTVIASLPFDFRPRYIWTINLSYNGLAGAYLEVEPVGDIKCYGLAGSTRITLAGDFYVPED